MIYQTTTLPILYQSPQTIVITGGTGSFGQAFARLLMTETPHHVRIFSRDEHKQEAMWTACPPGPRLTYIIGDVRDTERLKDAFDGADAVVHAAALKIVRTGEVNADEVMKTNIEGSLNVVEAALAANVRRTLLISTDKAVQPISGYGVSKAKAERLFTQANIKGVSRGCIFACVRGGNVWASRGSVAERWHDAIREGRPLVVADPASTRFHLPMLDWTRFCRRVLEAMHGGEIFVPKAHAWRLGELACAFLGANEVMPSGLRSGDKRHETLISEYEMERARDVGWAYVVAPPDELRRVWNYREWEGTQMSVGAYTSLEAEKIDMHKLRELIGETWK